MTNQKRIMVVGASWDQGPIIKEARALGHYVIALDGNPQSYGFPLADKSVVVSTRDEEGVLKVAREERVDAITYMITESPLKAIRHAAEALGLPGPSEKSVQATMSKSAMRSIFQQAGIPDARFGAASTRQEAVDVAARVGVPLVMKAADVGGQLGLYRIRDLADVGPCFERSVEHSVSGQVIIEEWLEGEEVNVVGIVLDGRLQEVVVSDRIKHPTMAFGIVQRHLYPSSCSDETLEQIHDICQRTVSAMEIRDGIVFPQLIVTPSGPKMAETGERIPGGVMKELYELATGYDLVRLQLDISLGVPIDLPRYKRWPAHGAVTVKFLNCQPGPVRPGKVARVENRDEVLAMDGIFDAQFYNDPTRPQEARPLLVARDRFYYLIAFGDTRDQVIEISDKATQLIDFIDKNNESLKVDET